MKKIPFNVNDYVLIKLTDRGKEILKKNYDELQLLIIQSGGKPTFEFKLPKTDENGYSKHQLWSIMSEFGKYLYLGCEAPFEMNMFFEVKGEEE